MNYVSLTFGVLIFLLIGIFVFIIPTIKCAKNILKNDIQNHVVPIKINEILALVVIPILGYVSLFVFSNIVELLDWRYIISILKESEI